MFAFGFLRFVFIFVFVVFHFALFVADECDQFLVGVLFEVECAEVVFGVALWACECLEDVLLLSLLPLGETPPADWIVTLFGLARPEIKLVVAEWASTDVAFEVIIVPVYVHHLDRAGVAVVIYSV